MLIQRSPNGLDLGWSSEITHREVCDARRSFIKRMAIRSLSGAALSELVMQGAFAQGPNAKLSATLNSSYALKEKLTKFKDVRSYNKHHEVGTDNSDPPQYAGALKTRSWTITVEGEIKKLMTLDVDTLMKMAALEEHIYRLRCVEGWSMAIAWIGFPLSELIKCVEPNCNAKYVEFTTLADNKQMVGIGSPVLEWPFVEGLRSDEAKLRLAMLVFGMYGQVLPNQNGAPVRIVVPWKYGHKSPKSIVKIRFVRDQPRTDWNAAASAEYGFYSNVNPGVDHPRWSRGWLPVQKSARRCCSTAIMRSHPETRVWI
jgi:sulfoxide reductase catalytic subunit YedY